MSDNSSRTRWHLLLGKLLECLLTPKDIQVQVEPQLMSEAPRGDIILLRRKGTQWTAAQKAALADGIRDSKAGHILLEFKYTESVNRDAVQQALGYEYFYRHTQKLKPADIGCFLVSAKTPQAATLSRFGYETTEQAGVYRSKQHLLNDITLILLNDLADTPQNAWLKIFASKQLEKIKALQHVQQAQAIQEQLDFYWFTRGLFKIMFRFTGEQLMALELTPEDIVEMNKIDKLFEGTPFERSILPAKVAYELSQLTPEERLEVLKQEELRKALTPEEIFSQFTPEDILKGLAPEDIEAYLEKIKRNPQH